MENILTLTTKTNEPGPVRLFFRRTGMLLFHPGAFFREEFPRLTGSEAAALGLTNAWLAALVGFFVTTLNSLFLTLLFERWMQNLLASEEGFSLGDESPRAFAIKAGMLLLTPFLVLMRVFFGGTVLYLFTRVLVEDDGGGPEPIRFPAVLKIEAVCQSARWFAVVPLVGGLLAFVVDIILLITGVRIRFGLSSRRATAIVLAPYIVLTVLGLLIVAFVIFALSQLPLHELLEMDTNGFGF